MKTTITKILSSTLAMLLIFTVLPMAAAAQDAAEIEVTEEQTVTGEPPDSGGLVMPSMMFAATLVNATVSVPFELTLEKTDFSGNNYDPDKHDRFAETRNTAVTGLIFSGTKIAGTPTATGAGGAICIFTITIRRPTSTVG